VVVDAVLDLVVEVASVEIALILEPRLEEVDDVTEVFEVELGFVVLDDNFVAAALDDLEFDADMKETATELDRLLAQTSCVEPISHAPSMNDSKTNDRIAFGFVPLKTLNGTVIFKVLPVILVGMV
jgi:hypothetical protein